MLFVCLFMPARLQGCGLRTLHGLTIALFSLHWLDVHARPTLTHIPAPFTNCAEALLFVELVDLLQPLQSHQKAGRGRGARRLFFYEGRNSSAQARQH